MIKSQKTETSCRQPIGPGPEDYWLRENRFSPGLLSRLLRRTVLEKLATGEHGNGWTGATSFFGTYTEMGIYLPSCMKSSKFAEFELFILHPDGKNLNFCGPARSSSMGWDEMVKILRADAARLAMAFKNDPCCVLYSCAKRARERREIDLAAKPAHSQNKSAAL